MSINRDTSACEAYRMSDGQKCDEYEADLVTVEWGDYAVDIWLCFLHKALIVVGDDDNSVNP
jgi:hypothetical protein